MFKPEISNASITLAQDEDCAGRGDHEYQEVRVNWQDGGGGLYPALASERWAWAPEDLAELQGLINNLQAVMDAWNKKQQARNKKHDKKFESGGNLSKSNLAEAIKSLDAFGAPVPANAGDGKEIDDNIPFMLKDKQPDPPGFMPGFKPKKRAL